MLEKAKRARDTEVETVAEIFEEKDSEKRLHLRRRGRGSETCEEYTITEISDAETQSKED